MMDEEDAPGPVTLQDAVLRTPLHLLPAGFRWGLWVLGAAVGGLPVLVEILQNKRISLAALQVSAGFCGILFFFYLLFVLGGQARRTRWVRLVYGSIIAALLVWAILDRLGRG